MSHNTTRNLSLFLAFAITLGSLGPLHLTGSPMMTQSLPFGLILNLHLTPHRLLHFLAFGTLATLLSTNQRRRFQRILAAGAVISLGTLIETLQFIGSTNPFEYWDLRDDACAVAAGYLTAEVLLLRRRAITKN